MADEKKISEKKPAVDKDERKAIDDAEERNALIAAWDTINVGNRHTWKVSRKEIETVWGKSAFNKGKLSPILEYKGLPVELDE